jgi:hypothetical protein
MRRTTLVMALLAAASPAGAQTWNDAASRALVERCIARRAADAASGLRDFRARAHGFVFFLAQLGAEGLEAPPRLVKSDQLELEVYWQASGRSKQRIIGWRDRAELPTDIQYHRDHLGIVMNGFADRIRIGEGDEVRDVPHPLAADGPGLYDYALVDSVRIDLPGRSVRALEVAFRPRDFAAARVVGSLFLDADGGELVRMDFSFTRAAYLDESLEDIAITLENGLWDGRYWLPRRQEIEIRRRSTWLDVPARGIIRGRWDIEGYAFNEGLPERLFTGPEIIAAPTARDSFAWEEPLDAAVLRELGPGAPLRLDEVREVAQSIAGPQSISGLRTRGLAVRSASEVAHVNRVEGLALGMGYLVRPRAGPFHARAHAGFGFAGSRITGGLEVGYRLGTWRFALRGERAIRDVADEPVISGVLNSFLAQEGGKDYGDYVRLDAVTASVASGLLELRAGYVAADSLTVTATPVWGSFRPNADLSSGDWWVGGLIVRGRTQAVVGGTLRGALRVEGGLREERRYARVHAEGSAALPAGPGELRLDAWGGWASADLPAHRSFVFGGRGTLVGEPFRAYGGREAVLARVAWALPLPAPAVPLGRYASTGRQFVVAPFLAVGWAGAPLEGLPWGASDGGRPVLGVSLEAFHRLLLVEAGWAIRGETVGVTVDVRRDLWPIL